ncbi:AzlD domain-containing protein [Vogesella facilis]|uniref:AzlD domain-containing protein n=1 Tax=Vogesella facilis TaxID=1655232 RepID=A0ABV7RGQ8_9NEIS
MLPDTVALWLAFILVGLATTLPRSSFLLAPKKYQPSQHFYAALKYAPIAALTAIIVPDVLAIDQSAPLLGPKTVAAVGTVLTILLTRNPWLPFVTGTASLLLLHALR